jgi:hypothetical protein
MRIAVFVASLFVVCPMWAQNQPDHLSNAEIVAATKAPPNSGFVYIMDENFFSIANCKAQVPGESIFTPAGWITSIALQARKQYAKFDPTPDDTSRVLTIVSEGCATGAPTGPSCDSVTRAVLISDKGGAAVVEPISATSVPKSWHNGYGATATCSALVSKFSMADIQKVRNAKGEFIIAVFSGLTHTKTYTVKERFLKKLGM